MSWLAVFTLCGSILLLAVMAWAICAIGGKSDERHDKIVDDWLKELERRRGEYTRRIAKEEREK
jgi:hypothetical protein